MTKDDISSRNLSSSHSNMEVMLLTYNRLFALLTSSMYLTTCMIFNYTYVDTSNSVVKYSYLVFDPISHEYQANFRPHQIFFTHFFFSLPISHSLTAFFSSPPSDGPLQPSVIVPTMMIAAKKQVSNISVSIISVSLGRLDCSLG